MIRLGFFDKKREKDIFLLSEDESEQEKEKIRQICAEYEFSDLKIPENYQCQHLEISGYIINKLNKERFYFRSWFVWDGWSIITLHHDDQEKRLVEDKKTREELYYLILTFCYSKFGPRLLHKKDQSDYEKKILKIILDKTEK